MLCQIIPLIPDKMELTFMQFSWETQCLPFLYLVTPLHPLRIQNNIYFKNIQRGLQTFWFYWSMDNETASSNPSFLPHTYTQHCRLVLGPPNLGLSRQFMHFPQSSVCKQPLHSPHLRERNPKQFREGRRNFRGFCSTKTGLSGSESAPTPKLNRKNKKQKTIYYYNSFIPFHPSQL